ncbi:transmembrane protein 164 isoform X2 [Coccinella septempunctata]|nr:transmembrane protein 164 isoform X2 [Coccinella septempunctata]XP_044751241.1 transmembrane protein 164 isoform X2 [Coccinella septempunctata]XP_044751242.1 transmembrane protein 164 isoform X2 [Coccinella septempunctata]XP_044751243.1 transmembrane protein 164 isoform X2 [Coccinella septempunctata]
MDWVYDGVNTTVPRNAGPECAAYMNPTWRKIETTFLLLFAIKLFDWSRKRISLSPMVYEKREMRNSKILLLVVMCVIWGMEIGYKFSSRTVIYLLNPCHVTTAIQIYLLAAAPSKLTTAIFRVHMNLLNGPLLAFLFPETDTRILPLETAIYWIQHGMMFVVPYYLLFLRGPYNTEDLFDFSWSAFSYSINMIYHFGILQTISIPTEVNLNHMLCPAILDPFDSQLYRICGVFHQAFLCPFMCKFVCVTSKFCSVASEMNKSKDMVIPVADNKKQMEVEKID